MRSEPYTEETAAGYGPCGGAAALFDETQALTAADDANNTAAEAFHCYGEFSERTEDREPFGEAKQYTWTPDTGSELLRSLVFTPTLLNSEMSYGVCQQVLNCCGARRLIVDVCVCDVCAQAEVATC